MKRKNLMFAACLLFSAVCATGAFAQVTVSGGLAVSAVTDVEVSGWNPNIDSTAGIGGNLFVDYLLPIGIPLSLGGEIGVDGAKFTIENDGEETIVAIPLLVRVAYHFDLMPKLDLYVVGKIGYVPAVWEGTQKDNLENAGVSVGNIGGLGFGFDIGTAYYFNPKVGAFAELGFDGYMLESEISGGGMSATLKAPFYRFVTIGASVKF
ncbi:MAG: porin family protein [Treponema sp.]|nr:porin family protein [Treponema sp.]